MSSDGPWISAAETGPSIKESAANAAIISVGFYDFV